MTPAWITQPRFTELLKLSVKNSLLLPALKDLLKIPSGNLNPLVMQNLTATSSLNKLRQILVTEGMSCRASNFIANSRKTSSIKHNEPVW